MAFHNHKFLLCSFRIKIERGQISDDKLQKKICLILYAITYIIFFVLWMYSLHQVFNKFLSDVHVCMYNVRTT